jgi:hypothetical protein
LSSGTQAGRRAESSFGRGAEERLIIQASPNSEACAYLPIADAEKHFGAKD